MTIKGPPDLVTLSIESADEYRDPDSNLMCEGTFGGPTIQVLMASQSVCCKLVRVYFVGELSSCARKNKQVFSWLSIME